jgi:MFS family permease
MTIAAAQGREEVPHRALVTVSIMLATVMQALDTTIANVALPHMQGSLSAAQDQITWVLTSYIVAAAVATPLTGWLAGRFGRKRLFLVSVAGFTVASGLCGIAGSLSQIVLCRLLQGVFGAALVPLSQGVLLDINPKEKHGQAMAIWGAGIMVGPILGPTLAAGSPKATTGAGSSISTCRSAFSLSWASRSSSPRRRRTAAGPSTSSASPCSVSRSARCR